MLKTSAQTTETGTEADGLALNRTQPTNDQGLAASGLAASGLAALAHVTESRQDPMTGAWTIFAPDREQRPDEYQAPGLEKSSVKFHCPFCVGSESNTPPAVWVGKLVDCSADKPACFEPAHLIYRGDAVTELAADDWTVRVVPNRFPALTPVDPKKDRLGRQLAGNVSCECELFRRQIISGGHEVIIEAPRHVRSITELDLSEIALLFSAYRDRIAHWHNTNGIAYISVFKNVGGQAGASLKHSHSQLIASDIIPTQVKLIAGRLAKYRAQTGCCLQCDIIRAELKEGLRVIANSDSIIAYCPFASPMPMMTRVTSVRHLDRFDQLSDQEIVSVSRMVFRVISWLEKLHPGTAYNMLLHTRPPAINDGTDTLHWSIDIFPRLTRIAGFEFSSDCKINPMMPEVAARRYRNCASAEDPRLVL